jgi:hypothetical protein
VAGVTATGAFGAGLLDQLDVLSKASGAFQVWWISGACVLGLIGGILLGAASFCMREP